MPDSLITQGENRFKVETKEVPLPPPLPRSSHKEGHRNRPSGCAPEENAGLFVSYCHHPGISKDQSFFGPAWRYFRISICRTTSSSIL